MSDERTGIIGEICDFGDNSIYVASMKGVILSIDPKITIVDISNEVRKFDIAHGSFILKNVVKYFPDNTVFLCVVDPGVGSKRKRIVIKTKRSYFVGPDNGLMIYAAEQEGIEEIREITNPKCILENASTTFDGRDVFAPTAALLASGKIKFEEIGPIVQDYVKSKCFEAEILENTIRGRVIDIDGFGNIITNIKSTDIKKIGINVDDLIEISFKGKKHILHLRKTYSDEPPGQPLVLIGSSGLLEVSVNQSHANILFNCNVGDHIEIKLYKKCKN